ncbi:hypothetical protein AAL_02384 [Moelleriella libera RCEF 2490]|uniref:Uncharacterized protein n=1 Tax=Moelleriella libera RCEF 2490 TaxID=1081109 RepID=A0A168EIE3_9HYPO|nr:hypothetical protein AAL_02384 [Moelleriella libera RCEF 2490]
MILAARHGPQLYEIRDVTAEVVDGYDGLSPPALDFGDDLDETSTGKAHAWAGPSVAGAHQSASSNGSASYPHSLVSAAGSTPISSSLTDLASPQCLNPPASPVTRRQTARAVADLIFFSQSGDLSAANNPIAGEGHPKPSTGYLHHGQSCTPNDSSFEDGIFLPGSTYHELHATLRSHLIHGTRPNASTRPVSPTVDREATEPFIVYRDGRGKCSIDAPSQPSLGPPNDQAMISKQEECSLWCIWFEEISPWLDKFDNNRHFQHTIPTLASTHGHLHYSILALCARQQELKDKARPTGQSLALYQEAIHGLLPDLASRSTEVIASCVILCVLEMLSCSPMAWQRHLDGCASFLNAVRANGFAVVEFQLASASSYDCCAS